VSTTPTPLLPVV